jgi:hypothetical protein
MAEGGGLIGRVRDGFEVRASDGRRVGKVAQVWYGSASAGRFAGDETVMEVRPGFLGRGVVAYIPDAAIADVSGKRVTLNVDAEQAKQWGRKPAWIAAYDR